MPISNVGTVPVSMSPPVSVQRSADVQPAVLQEKPQKQEPKRTQPQAAQTTAANLEKFVFNRKLQFVVDHNSNQVIVKVIDKETDKLIKVLPPEELQRLHRNLKESIGFLFDERV